MMKSIVAIAVVLNLALATASAAQLGQIGKALQKGQEAQKDLTITDDEERQIGADISAKLRDKYGVVQDPAVHKYVTLVGTVLASQSSRSTLKWTFVVLDTDGVNAFAAPGGFIHITRGALAMIQNEAELADVLAHEISHVTEKHTINAIKKEKGVSFFTQAATRNDALRNLANAAYSNVLENKYDRTQEKDADRLGVTLASQAGYSPAGLGDFLTRLAARDKDLKEPSGLFASHPDTQDRLANLGKLVPALKMTASATVAARYHASVAFKPAAIDGIAASPEPAKPASSGGSKFGLGSLSAIGNEKSSNQTVSSAGSRGVNPDRDAKGGPIKTPVVVTVTAAEITEFKKGIAG
jgi:predicted Zn-dependent protease